jgi:hypothetical protein
MILDSATWGAYNELLRVIKFVIDIKIYGLKVHPRLDNSNWASDPDTRVSVTGFIIYLLNLPIYWCSKSKKE